MNRRARWTPTGTASPCMKEQGLGNSWSISVAGLQPGSQIATKRGPRNASSRLSTCDADSS